MALSCRPINEDRELTGCVVKSGKLELGIKGGTLAVLLSEGLCVALLERCPNVTSDRTILNLHETPWLA